MRCLRDRDFDTAGVARASDARAGCAVNCVQGLETTGLDFAAAFLADPVLPPLEPLQCFFDRSEFVLGGIVDRLQGLVVLQLDCPIAPVSDQGLTASLQVGFDAAMTLDQGPLAGQKGLLDVGQIALWNRHAGSPISFRCG